MERPPIPSETHRVLAAIVVTDAVSFSARMSEDEEGTLRLIQRDLHLMGELCEQAGGQVLKSTGDGLLLSFTSAVQAVSCSQTIQTQLAELAKGRAPQDSLQHRIGIHLGDMLFSHSDVLGNGVNIAARLQTQSVPGGICISQTVYDVVKARLDLEAQFLGPLHLKNIREPVAAYQIPPVGIAPEEAVTGADPLDVAVQSLKQDPDRNRVKKLLFGTRQSVWENDPTVLARFELQELLQALLQRYPTLDALETAFHSIVARLNRQTSYLAVASRILMAVQPVYDQRRIQTSPPAEQTAMSVAVDATAITDGESIYQKIALQLTASPQAIRIRKLLHSIVNNRWENDPAILTQQEMDGLVASVYKIAPTVKELSYHLDRIVNRLSRQDHYARIAETIVGVFQQLYGLEEGTVLAKVEDKTSLNISPHPVQVETGLAADGLAADENEEHTLGDPHLSTQTRWETMPTEGMTRAITIPPGIAPPKIPAEPLVSPRDRSELFALRLEIMRYTNPLRAKILLLSTIRSPFTFTPQDWRLLKAKTLDNLLQETFEYCPSFADLEGKLTIIASCLDNHHANTQAAGAILQAMKPYYAI
ncbi:MAG: adenylate/guanylate cyclase domain-containing protein [Cyanobacteria bacterium]|nr:adenylate/guanylate cyclase domain-containing protein [Cyanobacteriota bacterium]